MEEIIQIGIANTSNADEVSKLKELSEQIKNANNF